MQTELILSIIGLAGGIICACADILLDLKGRDNKKIGKYGFIDSKWLVMNEKRFTASIIIAMLAVPMYGLGVYSLGCRMSGGLGTAMKLTAFVGSMGGFFIHAVLCLMPVIYKTISNEALGERVINRIYETIKFPFYLLYLILALVPSIIVDIAIFGDKLNVPVFCVFLNPIVFLIVGVLLRKIKYDWFYDLPGICMPSLGLGMFGLIGIIDLM